MDDFTNTEDINPKTTAYLMVLRSEIQMLNIDSTDLEKALKNLNVLEIQFESGNPDKTVVAGLISSLPTAAMVSSIGASLLACL